MKTLKHRIQLYNLYNNNNKYNNCTRRHIVSCWVCVFPLCFHLFFLYLSDRFWLFVMKSVGVSCIKRSCGLITDEMSVSVKAKPHFDIITRLSHTRSADTSTRSWWVGRRALSLGSFIIPWRDFNDLNTGLSASWLLLYSHLQTVLLIKAVMISVCLPQAPICWSLWSY